MKTDRLEAMRVGLRSLLVLLAVAGMTVSWMALKVHNQKPGEAPPCAVTERFDCGAVNHSRFAVFPPTTFGELAEGGPAKLHVPIAMVGLAAYGLMGVCAAAGWLWVLLELAQVGFLMAAFLTYIEAYVLEKWCIYCLWSQAIVATMLVVTAVAVVLRWRERRRWVVHGERGEARVRAGV